MKIRANMRFENYCDLNYTWLPIFSCLLSIFLTLGVCFPLLFPRTQTRKASHAKGIQFHCLLQIISPTFHSTGLLMWQFNPLTVHQRSRLIIAFPLNFFLTGTGKAFFSSFHRNSIAEIQSPICDMCLMF